MPRRQNRRPPTTGPRHQVRIIGGRWRGRKLSFPDAEGLRPSGDRIRETLFNWLAPWLPGARCLDLFAGSGALGFEALSRGAAHATLLEKDAGAAALLRESARMLGAGDSATVVETDTLQWLETADGASFETPFNAIFLDPPFATDWYAGLLQQLIDRRLAGPDTLVYVESDRPLDTLGIGADWMCLREKRAGLVYHGLYRLAGTEPEN